MAGSDISSTETSILKQHSITRNLSFICCNSARSPKVADLQLTANVQRGCCSLHPLVFASDILGTEYQYPLRVDKPDSRAQ
jgi:hypothetical protein